MASLYARATGNTWSRPSAKHQNANMRIGGPGQIVIELFDSARTHDDIAEWLRGRRKSQSQSGVDTGIKATQWLSLAEHSPVQTGLRASSFT